ncbi:sensor domain-containing phosphodiesterase [Williamsia deligens]|uniref:EAL domain-containing protein n=1 Tax=Williamsia deligens TaxID=321325 RepID=A0ABW3G716_9NOCA|nr:EAL domain-containing protein [Williamsia deligens]MCP2193353.1 EAL domain, c-di-GMP-specific phosphodiesterase class I (or its enzymatically inactive variant) [Williamsia deligens]
MADDERRARSAAHYLDLPATDALRAVVDLARRHAGADVAAITIVGGTGHRTLVAVGAEPGETRVAGADAACLGAIDVPGPVVVADAANHTPITAMTQAMLDAGFASYVAIPLTGREGLPVGSLVIAHTSPLIDLDIPALTQCGLLAQHCLDSARSDDTDAHTSTIGDIVDAFTVGDIRPWYMPIVDLTTHRVRAVEALARWAGPERTAPAPDQFIPIIENTDHIIDFDLTMLRHALSDLTAWRRQSSAAQALNITVNFSAHHFYRPDCVARIDGVVRDFDVDPTSIGIEITETAAVPTRELIDANVIDALRSRGYRVMLDDIGGMWLPTPHLLAFTFDGFKADRTIGSSLHTPAGTAVARALTTLTADLGAVLVIEGIETPAQAQQAAHLGAAYGQGYLWSPPRPAADLLDVVDSINGVPSTGPERAG